MSIHDILQGIREATDRLCDIAREPRIDWNAEVLTDEQIDEQAMWESRINPTFYEAPQ